MPPRTNRPCRRPGCPAVTRDKDGYCEEHKAYGLERKRQNRPAKKDRDKRHHLHAWSKKSKAYRSRNPLCEDCLEQGITKQADMVDHIEELKDGGALFDDDNLRGLCNACHARKTARARRERAGGGGARSYF